MLIDLPTTGETLAPIEGALPFGTSRHIIPNGVDGTAKTIAMMQKMVGSGKRDDDVRKFTGDAIQPCKPKDYFDYARKCYEKVRDGIKYAYDPHNVEYLESPRRVIKNKIADCDSQDMLLCSMFEQVGLQSQFVTIKADPNRPDEYTHVYTRVMIPKVGWVCADPIMPEKWFGWEPDYPNGKRYWPASSDDANGSVDTTPSMSFPSPDSGAPSQMSFDPVNGMTGMGSLGHGGHGGHGHGGRGRGGWGWGGGYGWGGPDYWGGFDDSVYILPVAVPVPDQITVVQSQDIQPQEMESPMAEENMTMGVSGLGSIFDSITSTVNSAITSVSSTAGVAAGVKPPISDDTTKWWITRIFDGTEAQRLKDARNKAFTNSDTAAKALRDARNLPDGPRKTAAVNAATMLRDAASNLQYSINDAMAKYNEIAALIGGLSYDSYNIPKLSGLGSLGFPTTAVTAAVASVAIAWAVYAYSSAWAQVSDNVTKVELARIELAKVNPNAAAAMQPGQSKSGDSFLPTNLDAFGGVVLKYGLVFAGIFIAYKAVSYGLGVADLKVKKTLQLA